ncbi:MAG TPA: PaaI family thioesterase [Caldimonas sp.]
MDVKTLQAAFDGVAADYVKRLNLRVSAVRPGEVEIAMPVAAELVHGGGVLCGQAMMAAADTAMVLVLIADLGEFRPMTTVQLQTSFLRPVPRETSEVAITARVLRRGKSLAFGEISIRTPDGQLAAQATTTYALL